MMIGATATRTALAIAAAGILGGLSLSAYTERGMWPRSQVASPLEAYRIPAGVPAAPIQHEPQEVYVCYGCGPTLAERQMQYYAYGNIGEGDYGYADEEGQDAAPVEATPPLEEPLVNDADVPEAPPATALSEGGVAGGSLSLTGLSYPPSRE
jgi:hypothetical protein